MTVIRLKNDFGHVLGDGFWGLGIGDWGLNFKLRTANYQLKLRKVVGCPFQTVFVKNSDLSSFNLYKFIIF